MGAEAIPSILPGRRDKSVSCFFGQVPGSQQLAILKEEASARLRVPTAVASVAGQVEKEEDPSPRHRIEFSKPGKVRVSRFSLPPAGAGMKLSHIIIPAPRLRKFESQGSASSRREAADDQKRGKGKRMAVARSASEQLEAWAILTVWPAFGPGPVLYDNHLDIPRLY